MSMRTALEHNKLVTFFILGALLWILLVWTSVFRATDWGDLSGYVGTNAVGGIVGLVVMAGLAGLLVVLYSEYSQEQPAPRSWPPE